MSRRSRIVRAVTVFVDLADGAAPDMTTKFGAMVFAPHYLIISWHASGTEWGTPYLKTNGPQRLKSGRLSDKNTASYDWRERDPIPEWVAALVAFNTPNPIDIAELAPEPAADANQVDLDGIAT